MPTGSTSDITIKFLNFARNIAEYGIRKLFAISLPLFLPDCDLIYVGSAPGIGWAMGAEYARFTGKILSYDPRPLHASVNSANVIHRMIKVTQFTDVLQDLEESKRYIFIWDVRSDTPEDLVSREAMLADEVETLNRIVTHADFPKRVFLVQLKINLHALELYNLPVNGSFYPQPYVFSRDILETRYVAFIPNDDLVTAGLPPAAIAQFSETMYQLKEQFIAGTITDEDLFVNFLTSRYRQCDYISSPPIIPCEHEIVLFSINHNAPERVISYLEALRDRKSHFVISFFTGEALNKDEHVFPEGDTLRLTNCTFFDTRLLVGAKLSHLYFVADELVLDLYKDELLTSETYMIKQTEFHLHSKGLIGQYDIERMDYAEKYNFVFAKFPNSFSISQKIISPSGHAARMMVESNKGNVSFGIFLQKILRNFCSISATFVSKKRLCARVPAARSWLLLFLQKTNVETRSLERSPRTLWHSVDEWRIGTLAGERVYAKLTGLEPTSLARTVYDVLSDCVLREHYGEEIKHFLETNYGSLTPLKRLPARSVRRDRPEFPMNLGPLETAARIYENERDRGTGQDWCRFFLQNNASSDSWRAGISVLQADSVARDTIVHREYIVALDERFPNHDASKHGLLEILLACLRIREPATDSRFYSIPHFWRNKHHPEYSLVHKVRNRLEIEALTIPDILTLLREIEAEMEALDTLEPEDDLTDYEELVIDLAARRWQKDLWHQRAVNWSMITKTAKYVLRKPYLSLEKYASANLSVASRDGVLYRNCVMSAVKAKYPYAYP